MKKNNESKLKFLLKITFCFTLLLIALLIFAQYSNKSFATDEETSTEQDTSAEYCYLSDMDWAAGSKSGWGDLLKDKTSSNSKISVKVEGAYYAFDKGIWAHATSTVIYDLRTTPNGEKYDYFTAYIGLNQTAASSSNGVKFFIYTSKDGTNWDLKTDASPAIFKAGTEAEFVKIKLKDENGENVNWLKLVADSNGSNGNDHAVYADAKLIKEGYKEPGTDLVPSITELDEKIKQFASSNADLSTNPEYELALLKRELISRVGNYALRKFLNDSEGNKAVYEWLTSDLDILRLYIMGGTPEGGSYYNSLTQLARLYDEYSTDFTNNTPIVNEWCKEGMTRGDLYTKMAITLSLTHTQRVGLWMQSGVAVNQSDALRRYAIYKYLYENGKLNTNLGGNWDITKWFEALQVEEMRYVMNNIIDDEEILWLNTYVQDRLDQYKQSKYITPHPYIAYVWPNYQNAVYYAPENVDYFNELFAVNKRDDNNGQELVNENGENTGKVGLFDTEFTIPGGKNNPTYTFKVTRGTPDNRVYKVWMNFRNKFGTGCVCGGISKSGSNIRTTHGIPAVVIGQPGHAALLYYTKNTQGQGYWGIDNDVSGWTKSEKGERMPLGWGNASYSRGYSVVYIVLAQEAINDYENLIKCEEQVMLAKVYANDLADETTKQTALEKQEEIYRKALEIQPINIDAWVGLINVYNANANKTENDFYDLAEDLAENLKCFPLPMYHLTNLIKPKLTSAENSYKFALLQARILKEGSALPNSATDQVLQPSITRTEANYLLGQADTSIATFSFDGTDAGKIVMSSRFDGNGLRVEYSLDGKQTWKEVAFEGDEEHKIQLTQEELNSITADTDIHINIVGVPRNDNTIFKIDITAQSNLANLYANDLENRVVGINLSTEWRYTEEDAWTSYGITSPDLTGNKTVQVRQAATGTKLASEASPMYTFTEDNQPDTRKYIPVAHLAIEGYSTQSKDNKRPHYAPNAIDGNGNTLWHTDFAINVLQQPTKPFITIKLDSPRYISALEFTQKKYKANNPDNIKNVIIYVSEDGENWTEAGRIENCSNPYKDDEVREVTFNESVYGQYVKLEMESYNMFVSLSKVNLFEDTTKIEDTTPTAGIYYSTTETTNGVVVARLVNQGTEVTITNNGGSDTYIFTENGEFTFEFIDAKGNKGTAVATVTWIDKDEPTADVEYELDTEKKLVISLDGISEDVYLLDKNNNKINYIEVQNGKVTNILYLDSSGDTNKEVAVDENGNITRIIYKNTISNEEVNDVSFYVTTMENGVVVENGEEYLDSDGNPVEVSDSGKEMLRVLQQSIANPLEYTFDDSGDYEFKMLDKASNILYKSIKVDYIENDTIILASDITYSITKLTNKDVTATINPYVIDTNGKHSSVEIVSEGGTTHTFTENGEFTFKYKDSSDTEDWEVKQHKAKVDWIDKTAPTAQITYSTTENTEGEVVATLVNESEEIIITNNGTSKEYKFTENGEFTFKFQDKAGNKGTAVAKVDWILEDTTVTSEKYKIRKNYISRIPEGTTVKEFKENIESNEELVVTDKDGKVLEETDTITVGMILKAGEEKQYNLVIEGDIDQDGLVTVSDLLKLKLFIVDLAKPTDIEEIAADLNENKMVEVSDLLKLKMMTVGL